MQKRTDERTIELAATSESQSLAGRDAANVDQFTETEDDVRGFGHKATKKPPVEYLQVKFTTILITSVS